MSSLGVALTVDHGARAVSSGASRKLWDLRVARGGSGRAQAHVHTRRYGSAAWGQLDCACGARSGGGHRRPDGARRSRRGLKARVRSGTLANLGRHHARGCDAPQAHSDHKTSRDCIIPSRAYASSLDQNKQTDTAAAEPRDGHLKFGPPLDPCVETCAAWATVIHTWVTRKTTQ